MKEWGYSHPFPHQAHLTSHDMPTTPTEVCLSAQAYASNNVPTCACRTAATLVAPCTPFRRSWANVVSHSVTLSLTDPPTPGGFATPRRRSAAICRAVGDLDHHSVETAQRGSIPNSSFKKSHQCSRRVSRARTGYVCSARRRAASTCEERQSE